ncbi:MAG TPA: hypothetical protein VET87_22080 [Rubrivivax sp.]|nr:hypothetical protein [Rubrivivax sp.]
MTVVSCSEQVPDEQAKRDDDQGDDECALADHALDRPAMDTERMRRRFGEERFTSRIRRLGK